MDLSKIKFWSKVNYNNAISTTTTKPEGCTCNCECKCKSDFEKVLDEQTIKQDAPMVKYGLPQDMKPMEKPQEPPMAKYAIPQDIKPMEKPTDAPMLKYAMPGYF